MNKRKKTVSSTPPYIYWNKDTYSARLIQSVRRLFLSGGKCTARQINSLCNTNDARKVIADLRNKEDWKIEDSQLPNICKLYWLSRKGGTNENS